MVRVGGCFTNSIRIPITLAGFRLDWLQFLKEFVTTTPTIGISN